MRKTDNLEFNLPDGPERFNRSHQEENWVKNDAVLMIINNVLMSTATFLTSSGTGTAMVVDTNSFFRPIDGLALTIIPHASNNGAATTIVPDGLTPIPLYKPATQIAPTTTAGKPITVWYNRAGNCFFIKASAEGNATAEHVLAPYTFSNGDDVGIVGTMVDHGNIGIIKLDDQNEEYTIQKGYHNGLGKIKAVITNLVASVIKAGTTVGGILGTFTADANAVAENILNAKTAYVNGAKITGNMPNRAGFTVAGNIGAEVGRLNMLPSNGYRDGVDDWVYYDDPDFIAANILSTKNIFGMQGSIPIAAKDASGIYTTVGLPTLADIYQGSIDFRLDADMFVPTGYARKSIPNLISANIKAGVSISGGGSAISGAFTADATAVATDICASKTAYVNGAKITGTGAMLSLAAGELPIVTIPREIRTAYPFYSPAGYPMNITFSVAGTVRLKFSLKNVSSAGGVAQWQKNGVAVGTQRMVGGSYVEYSEDFTVAAGDTFRLQFGVAGTPDYSSECAISLTKACVAANGAAYNIIG